MRSNGIRSQLSVALMLTGGLLLAACADSPTTEVSEDRGEAVTETATGSESGGAEASALCRLPETPPEPTAGTAAFSDYAWRIFLALSWPAETGRRGVPDCDAPLGGGPTVWETYKTTEQTFLPGGEDPGPWDEGEVGQATLLFRAKAPLGLPVEESVRQAVGGWLIDQAGNPTYYQIGIDRASYDYIRQNRYYDASVVSQATNVTFPTGSLEIKASWKILTSADDPSLYHHREAEVMTFDAQGNPTGTTTTATVGLVGFHAVYKAEGFPQWIWATFEHVDNAPTEKEVEDGLENSRYSYFNPDCTGPYCALNTSPLASGQPFGSPNQIVRITDFIDAVDRANQSWAQNPAVRDTPFRYYQLVSPQWPTAPNDPGQPQGAPFPSTVANVTMESYIQPTSSCMDCHSTARVPGDAVKSNYSFVFLFAQSSQPEGGGSQMEGEAR